MWSARPWPAGRKVSGQFRQRWTGAGSCQPLPGWGSQLGGGLGSGTGWSWAVANQPKEKGLRKVQ